MAKPTDKDQYTIEPETSKNRRDSYVPRDPIVTPEIV